MLLDMSLRVWHERLMFVMHTRQFYEDSLASQIYEEQKRENLPGLVRETEYICKQLSIEDCNTTRIGKLKYKQMSISACHTLNEKWLRNKAQGKCERINHELYEKKAYIKNKNIYKVRQQFRTRYGLQPFAGDYLGDKRYAKSDWLCKCQEAREEELHVMSGRCKVYGDLPQTFGDLSNDENLVNLFTAVLARRDYLDNFSTPDGGGSTNVGANLGFIPG